MKGINRLVIAALTSLLAACTVEEASVDRIAQTEEDEVQPSMESCYEQGVVTVKFTEEMAGMVEEGLAAGGVMTKSSELNAFVSSFGITSIERVFSDDERWLERQHREGLHLWYRISYDPNAVVATKAAGEFAEMPGVEIAEPCPKVKPVANYYNDPYYSYQWHLHGSYDINVESVWTNYTKGDPSVIVSVVDGGIDPSHSDLKANLIEGGIGGSKNFYNNSYTITAHPHGTHVGGIIAAVSNNNVGVAGIAGGDSANGVGGVRLLNSQVFSGEEQASDFSDAIRYGADNGALISQNSWGYSYDSETQAKNSTTPSVMTTAIDYFIKYAGCDNTGDQLSDSKMKGGVVIFAAGNDGWQYAHPADYESVIAVGATTNTGLRADYSNYGDWVDICAPGTDIYSTYYSGGSTYATASGTSMACPMVSGVAALVLCYQGGPGYTADNLKECLLEGASSSKVYAQNVGPYLDALGSVTYGLMDPPADIDSYSVSVSGNTIYFTWKVPAGNDEGTIPAYGMLLCASTNKSSIDDLQPRSLTSDVFSTTCLTETETIGSEVTAGLTVDGFNTTYYVTCVPFNYGARYADAARTQSVTTLSNNPPVIETSEPVDDIQVGASKSVSVYFDISDPDAHDVTVEYTSSSIAEKWTKTTSGRYVLTITGYAKDANDNYVDTGTYTSSVTATDSYGASTTMQVGYTILDNQAPYVNGDNPLGNVLLVLGNSDTRYAELDLDDVFIDPDGDALTYTVANTSSSTVQAVVNTTIDITATDTTSTTKLYLTAFKSGSATVTVTATDARGKSCSESVNVVVGAEGETVFCYPNPVTDVLRVITAEREDTGTTITISTSTGSTVYSKTSEVSVSHPADIDFSGFAPGTYSLRAVYGSTTVTKKVVKI